MRDVLKMQMQIQQAWGRLCWAADLTCSQVMLILQASPPHIEERGFTHLQTAEAMPAESSQAETALPSFHLHSPRKPQPLASPMNQDPQQLCHQQLSICSHSLPAFIITPRTLNAPGQGIFPLHTPKVSPWSSNRNSRMASALTAYVLLTVKTKMHDSIR